MISLSPKVCNLLIQTTKSNDIDTALHFVLSEYIQMKLKDLEKKREIFETKWHCNQAMLNMQEYIRPYMSNFEGMSILDWSRANGYKISDAWHPLEEAQAGAAKIVVDRLDSYIKQPV